MHRRKLVLFWAMEMDTEELGERINGEEETKTTKLSDNCSIDRKKGEGTGAGNGGSRKSGKSKAEKVCRICHFGKECSSKKEMELIPLGCDCKGQLGFSHHHCAQIWFTHKGDRICEICGKMAKNISNNGEEASIFMMEWEEMREAAVSLDAPGESRRRCKQCFCNVVLGILLLLFMLLWLFKGINI